MQPSGSYDVNRSHRDRNAEIERLRAQVLLSWEKEVRNLSWFGLEDGMTILELGSGPGFVTEQLLARFPRSLVTALEVDPDLVQQSKQYLSGQTRVDFVEASVMDTGLPDDSFDFAVARLIFQHLPDPVGAAMEIKRVLKPGGRLAVIDVDDQVWGIADPPLPEVETVLKAYGSAQAAQGGNRLIGRKLCRILKEAGYTHPDLETVIAHSDDQGIEAILPQLDPDRLLPLVREGVLSREQLDDVRRARERFLTSPKPYFALLMFMACGRKPAH